MKVKLVDEMMESLYLCIILHVKNKKWSFIEVLTWFIILGKIKNGGQNGDHCWCRHRPPAAPPPIKCTLSCWEEQRLSTEGKIVWKYYKITHARINGTVRVLFKTRLIFPRINGPTVSHVPRVMTSLLMSPPPISISHWLFRCRYSNSRDVVASSPSFCQSAPESLLAGYFLRTPSAPITNGIVSVTVYIFHILALSVHIIRPSSLFLGCTDHDRWELQCWIPSSVDVNTLFF